ncbi:AAA family ATPase [Promicromonospora thailandica]|uniref:AAA family ATPase n=1 Tax=Promicromonospora thailandica TaxID=765201 RepID=UPI0020A2C611|nr:AAA family ATPase [Promicromonospora thailandica]
MRRVSVVGASGSGKSTFARRLAQRLGAPYVELDALHWGPGWRPRADFARDAGRAVATDLWVVDGNYSVVRDAVWARADTVVWIDPPAPTVLAQVYGRSFRLALSQEELWPGTGNRQPWREVLVPWAAGSILRWSWAELRKHPARYGAAMADPANAHLTFHRLRTRRAADEFLARADAR